ncbi:MAG: PLP-dependent aminotransferase family protein [Thermoleophilia bacterium]|nr:PLP-dependent aminotransferase family protein [Thermoleophilia bacterium]
MRRITFDRFEDRYARRMGGMRSSAMRDLMAITSRPEVISLAGGLPDTAAFDPAVLEQITRDVASTRSAAALQYGPTEGLLETRELVVEVMRTEGMTVRPEDIIITTGGQQVLDLVARTFIDPGDVVLAEGPTYPGVVPVFSACQADVRQVPLDAEGLDPAAVESALDELAREGLRAKYLYTIPTFHNPGGTSTTLERRKRLVALAAERDLLILEDNPYSLLRYEGDPVPTLHQLDQALDGDGNVMYLGTFSKIFAPGVRLGWVAAPPEILQRLNMVKQAADLCSSTFSQLVVTRFFTTCDWQAYIDGLVGVYRGPRNGLLDALDEYLPVGSTFTRPRGGLFVWATLPPAVDTTDLLPRALSANVAFVPGAAAWLDGRTSSSMRLNFSAMTEERITEGVRRIGAAADDVLTLSRSLGLADGVASPRATADTDSATETASEVPK